MGGQGHGPASSGFWPGWRVCGCEFLGVPVPESRTMNDPTQLLKGQSWSWNPQSCEPWAPGAPPSQALGCVPWNPWGPL